MTTATTILADLNRLGVHLQADGEQLQFCPAALVTPAMRQQLQSHKLEIIAALKDPPPKPVCRCGSATWQDFPIHHGQSVRRDCAVCRRFICFTRWHGKPSREEGSKDP